MIKLNVERPAATGRASWSSRSLQHRGGSLRSPSATLETRCALCRSGTWRCRRRAASLRVLRRPPRGHVRHGRGGRPCNPDQFGGFALLIGSWPGAGMPSLSSASSRNNWRRIAALSARSVSTKRLRPRWNRSWRTTARARIPRAELNLSRSRGPARLRAVTNRLASPFRAQPGLEPAAHRVVRRHEEASSSGRSLAQEIEIIGSST